ncbi:MAG: hypothetical protein AAB681_00850 [Patescibacteria group bacterium]
MGQEALNSEVNNLNKVEDLAPVVSIEGKLNPVVTKEDEGLVKEKVSKLNEEIAEMEEKLQAKANTDRDYPPVVPTTVYLGDGDTEITPELLNKKKEELSKLEKTIPPKPKIKRTFLGSLFSWLP